MDIFADIVNQRFVQDFRHANDAVHNLTQNDEQPLRLFMVQPSKYPGSGHPFNYTAYSGDEDFTVIVSLRDVTTDPVTLASTETMTALPNGFEGVLHLNTEEIATFLSGRSQRDVELCIDMIDDGGHRFSPFRRTVTLRASDSGTTTPIPGAVYDPAIIGLTGGGLTNLDGIATVSKAVGSLQILTRQVSGAWTASTWKLIAGTTAEDEEGGVIRPDDYAVTTNEKVWVRVDGV